MMGKDNLYHPLLPRLTELEGVEPYLMALMAGLTDGIIGLVHKAVTVLTDAQIKALPTTPVALVASPGTGKAIVPFYACLVTDFGGGAYTNIDADATVALAVVHGTNTESLLVPLVDEVGSPAVKDFSGLFNTWAAMPFIIGMGPSGIGSYSTVALARPYIDILTGATAKALNLRLTNGDGDLTGGNAVNTLMITVYFVVVDV